MAFQVLVKNKTPEDTGFLDGILYARTGLFFMIYWNSTRGVHTLMAVNSKGIGKSISSAYAGDHACVPARCSAPARKNAVTPACTKRFGEGRHFGVQARACPWASIECGLRMR
jgi:hypothetical protein